MSGAKHAHGTVLTIGSTVDELITASGPSVKVDAIDVTNMDSADAWREFIPGLKDGGEITFDGNFIKAEVTALLALVNGNAVSTGATLALPSSLGTFTFDCFVTSLNVSAVVTDQVKASGTIKISGEPVLS